MRSVHRNLSIFLLLFAVYLAVTGTLIQLTDLRTLLIHAPANDPNMMAIREGLDGTADFQVIGNSDYTAASLPNDLNLSAAVARVMESARSRVGAAPVQFVELRVVNGMPMGQVAANGRLLRIGTIDGSLQEMGTPARAAGGTFGRSLRNTFKGLHRMTVFGDWSLWINVLVGVSLCVMLVTGVVMYARLLAARRKLGRVAWFWSAGGTWRSLHRATSLLSAIFLLLVALSGTWLAVESLGRAVMGAHERAAVAMGRISLDGNGPVNDSELPGMLEKTLSAFHRERANTGIRVLRLRNYGGMRQGVIVTGESEAHQLVFNAATGARASETEPGYPPQHFPFGWQVHQMAKQVHRGDFVGLTGRWMDLFAGLSLIYLTVSGAFMYRDLWRRRRRSGRTDLLWK